MLPYHTNQSYFFQELHLDPDPFELQLDPDPNNQGIYTKLFLQAFLKRIRIPGQEPDLDPH